MDLLEQIQSEAAGSNTDLSSLLRKCRVLAQRVGSEELKSWTLDELEGYSNEELVPAYRVFDGVILTGNYSTKYAPKLKNVQFPRSSMPADLAEKVFNVPFSQGVSQLQALAAKEDLALAVSQEALKSIKHPQVANHLILVEATRHIDTTFISGILDTIRTRVLNFSLELDSYAGESGKPLAELEKEGVSQIFNTQVTGNVQNIAVGHDNTILAAHVEAGDKNSLIAALKELALEEDNILEITDVAENEGAMSEKVKSVIGKAAKASGSSVNKIATTVIGKAVAAYFGV